MLYIAFKRCRLSFGRNKLLKLFFKDGILYFLCLTGASRVWFMATEADRIYQRWLSPMQ